jgi:hypothetical protein
MKNRKSFFTGLFGAFSIALLAITSFAIPATARGQAHDRHLQANPESAVFPTVDGGSTVQVSLPYDTAFASAVTYLNKNGMTVEKTDKDGGFIATSAKITGHGTQTMQVVLVTVIKSADGKGSSLRIASVTKTRKNYLQADPWGDPKIDDKQSATLAKQMQDAINTAPAAVASL